MARKGEATTNRKRGRGADPEQTKSALRQAAFDSLVEVGYRGTTAREIAERASCNQAAIYYHFGGIEALLIAALSSSSEERLARYDEALDGVATPVDLVKGLRSLYDEDRKSGHVAVLAELAGGVTANPDLRPGIDAATRPWLDFVETKIAEFAAGQPYGAIIPKADAADFLFSLVLGMELRNKIDDDDARIDRMFRLAILAAKAVEASTAD